MPGSIEPHIDGRFLASGAEAIDQFAGGPAGCRHIAPRPLEGNHAPWNDNDDYNASQTSKHRSNHTICQRTVMRECLLEPHECRIDPDIDSHRQYHAQSDVQRKSHFLEARAVVVFPVNEHHGPGGDRKRS